MKWFRRKAEEFYPPPIEIVDVEVDQLGSTIDLARGMNARRDAELQAREARAAVASLRASRVRNGFAPVIEESIIRRHLGST